MKKILLTLSLLLTPLFAKEIVCIPDALNTAFDEVVLTHQKGNKYQLKVTKDKTTLLSDSVSNVFLRRERVSRFRNKSQNIVIKTLKLYPNKVTRAQIQIDKFGTYNGFCKLYQ
ncbi:MAG: hypothetical protein GY909_18155 [Oligoflexia bacterium]|nr:hypothetical protein [Oligoflexia bacterium]